MKIQSTPNSRPASALGQTKVAAPVFSQNKNTSTIAKKPVAKLPINNAKTPSKTEKRTNKQMKKCFSLDLSIQSYSIGAKNKKYKL